VFDQRRSPLGFILKHALFAPSVLRPNQAQIRKRDSSLTRGQGADALLHEVRIRRSLLPLAARFEVLERVRPEGELLQRLPGLIGELALHNHHIPYRHNTKRTARLFLIKLGF